jgi:hypothetical protein
MLWLGFEPTIPAFKRAKTVHTLDRAATVIGFFQKMAIINSWNEKKNYQICFQKNAFFCGSIWKVPVFEARIYIVIESWPMMDKLLNTEYEEISPIIQLLERGTYI